MTSGRRYLYSFGFAAIAVLAGISTYHWVFSVPDSPRVISSSQGSFLQCENFSTQEAIDKNGLLNVAVWNIYKQQNAGWDTELSSLIKRSDLVLLQEASFSSRLEALIDGQKWHYDQAYAFSAFDRVAGVMSLSRHKPASSCAYTAMEPFLRLPKSALYNRYPLSDGGSLAVINLHAINFTFGMADYAQQLDELADAVSGIEGPIIIAGDFNSWSEIRKDKVESVMGKLNLKEAKYDPDNRLMFFGAALDHLYYRGMDLIEASVPETEASDHAMLKATFRLDLNLEGKG